MTNPIATYLKFANLQIAAEAFYGQNPNPKVNPNASTLAPGAVAAYSTIDAQYLTIGNNHSSLFTTVGAKKFSDLWEIVEYKHAQGRMDSMHRVTRFP
jgi:hypothetical protein